jgi:hypothetical protein
MHLDAAELGLDAAAAQLRAITKLAKSGVLAVDRTRMRVARLAFVHNRARLATADRGIQD